MFELKIVSNYVSIIDIVRKSVPQTRDDHKQSFICIIKSRLKIVNFFVCVILSKIIFFSFFTEFLTQVNLFLAEVSLIALRQTVEQFIKMQEKNIRVFERL